MDASGLIDRYQTTRAASLGIAKPLSPEDWVVQTMPDASPVKWHLAHTTWFFETFILKNDAGYECFDESFEYLFNSYYNSVGKQYPRPKRGLVTRPESKRILDYRAHVDEKLMARLGAGELSDSECQLLELGLNHEQQHQELMFTDLKHLLFCNPYDPVYKKDPMDQVDSLDSEWESYEAQIYEVGFDGSGFCFDNEMPAHMYFVDPFSLRKQRVSNAEFIQFMEDGGYDRPELWLSLGWAAVNEQGWKAPMYWENREGEWFQFTLSGWKKVHPDWPVCHVSYFEAEAFARWSGKRLPSEQEWERACEVNDQPNEHAQFAELLSNANRSVHPTRVGQGMLGGTWEWTQSSYSPYPGFAAAEGAVGEYNGKFMCNQYVLRGGSVATSREHIRSTYRNFFPPETRWQFSGIRLAENR